MQILSRSAAVAVKVDVTLVDRLREYQAITGIPLGYAVDEAVRDYIECVIPARLKAFENSKRYQNEKIRA